jgi:hypothetical protein
MAKKQKQKQMRNATNTETITELMEFAKCGPISQLFIMDALAKHADKVAKLTDEEAVEQIGNNGLIHPLAWRDAAKEVKATLDEHFAGKRMVPVKDEDDE